MDPATKRLWWALMVPLVAIGGAKADGPEGATPGGDGPRKMAIGGIDNFYRLGPDLYSGAQPEGEAAFEALKRLGIRTIVTVDGARPDVEAARRHGLRYVHLPFGYDGIPPEKVVALAKAARELPGPIYVHCHHGKHRGPAAAAICGLAKGGWSREQARGWLEEAGTDPAYKGLYDSMAAFEAPSEEELKRLGEVDFPEQADVPGLVEVMVEVDQRWDHLKAIRAAGFRTPADQPDLDPPHEALMLVELFREAARTEEARGRGESFGRSLQEAEQASDSLRESLGTFKTSPTAESREAVASAFDRVAESCTACHRRFRDRGPSGRPSTSD